MPINEFGMNSDYVEYFPLDDYVDKIKLMPYVLEHLESTNRDFDDYMRKLASYDEDFIINYWVLLLYQELKDNQRIENKKFDMASLATRSVFFETLNVNHRRVHELHNFAIEKEISAGKLQATFEYRDKPVNISRFDSAGNEEIFYRGANPEDVQRFMNDFLKIYKQGGTSLLFSNPFLVSSLLHLLFVRIHPYLDGNGRTVRVLHNIKFTEMINKLYGTRLKISPLNLSSSLLLNKITYVKRLNNIYFDLEHDTNDAINAWFDFILDMVDERIFVALNKMERIDPSKLKTGLSNSGQVASMRLSRIRFYR